MGVGKKNALDFNQKLAAITKELQFRGEKLGVELKTAVATHDFSKTIVIYEDLKGYIDNKIEELTATENVSGSENLKSAMLDFLKFEKKMIVDGCEPFRKINKDTPDDQVHTSVQAMMESTKEETTWLSRLQQAQREYAAKNGLKLQE